MSVNLFCADYSAIEARVLFWLSGHADGVAAFALNRPIYEEMAARIFSKPLSAIGNPSNERELGKRAVLGCGYNMGWEKFMETCQTFGDFKVDETLAKTAVDAYRELHYPVPIFWKMTERAAVAAAFTNKSYTVLGKTRWFTEGKFLYAELPSKRRIAFYGPEIKIHVLYECEKCGKKKGSRTPLYACPKCGMRMRRATWAEPTKVLYHWGVNPVSKKWECAGTYGGRLVENLTQGVARDLMAEAMLRVEGVGYRVVLSVHDELLAETENAKHALEHFNTLMAQLPKWAKGLPVKVAGWQGERYRK